MSQAIQYNSSVAMIRHPRFLQRAADLTPALQRLRQTPQAIVEAVAEPGALNRLAGEYRLHAGAVLSATAQRRRQHHY